MPIGKKTSFHMGRKSSMRGGNFGGKGIRNVLSTLRNILPKNGEQEKNSLRPPKQSITRRKNVVINRYAETKRRGMRPITTCGLESTRDMNVNDPKHLALYMGSSRKDDDEWVNGKPLKKRNMTRFWLQNPNGVKAKDDFRLFRGDLEDAKNNQIDFLALPETKLNANNSYVIERMHQIILCSRCRPGAIQNCF
jgi:hypothetical protein